MYTGLRRGACTRVTPQNTGCSYIKYTLPFCVSSKENGKIRREDSWSYLFFRPLLSSCIRMWVSEWVPLLRFHDVEEEGGSVLNAIVDALTIHTRGIGGCCLKFLQRATLMPTSKIHARRWLCYPISLLNEATFIFLSLCSRFIVNININSFFTGMWKMTKICSLSFFSSYDHFFTFLKDNGSINHRRVILGMKSLFVSSFFFFSPLLVV